MKTDLNNRVAFEFIRYANVWEDAELLLKAFQPLGEGKRYLSIASAGDNCFMLLLLNPEMVVAVDLNPVQLHLVELKRAAILHFERKKALEFLGFLPSSSRGEMLLELKVVLPDETYAYWLKQLKAINDGIVHQGKFEKYFQLFAKRILPWIHNKKRIQQLFLPKPVDEQEKFYHNKWNSWRWRMLFKVFFSKKVMGKYGRDPEFLKEVNVSVSNYIYMKAEKHLKSTASQSNYILYYNLNGKFDDHLPPYLSEANYDVIKSRLNRIHLMKGYAHEAIDLFGKFDGMNLSDIFEYMDKPLFEDVSRKLIEGSNTNARICYWNLMVPRRISGVFPNEAEYQRNLSAELTASDRGFFYNQFICDKIV